MGHTLTSQSLIDPSLRVDPRRRVAQLFVVMRLDEPLAPPSRHLLDGIDLVRIRRGAARAATRDTAGGLARLTLALDDRRASEEHAQIIAARGQWVLEDLGS